MRILWALIPLLASACISLSADAPDGQTESTLFLQYSMKSLRAPAREASFGAHCGTAKVDGDRVDVERSAYGRLGTNRSFLIVGYQQNPNANGFYTTGVEGYPLAFPAVVDPRINGTASPVARIDVRDGTVFLDGQAVAVPHSWNRTAPGDWGAHFDLTEGPRTVRLFDQRNCM